MKRFLHLICLLTAAALLPAALLVSRGLPADTRPYVEQKYAGWNGVLRAWICADWECAGSFIGWLNARAAAFEKKHDGVYIEFTPVTRDAMRSLGERASRTPELLLFAPGVSADLPTLKELAAPDALRSDLRNFGLNAFPVAMGGYIWVYNRELCAGAPSAGSSFALPADDDAHRFSAAAIALLSEAPNDASAREEIPDAGIDLGLAASANAELAEGEYVVSEDALRRFINGEIAIIAVSQSELAQLIRLRDSGRGPDWTCAASGQAAYTDQLLFVGVTPQTGDGAPEREALAESFANSLLEYEAQAKLADIGAFAVTGERIYSDFSAYAQLDILLNSRTLFTPKGSLPDCGALLRDRAAQRMSAADSLLRLQTILEQSF